MVWLKKEFMSTIKAKGFALEQLVARAIHTKLSLLEPAARKRVIEQISAYDSQASVNKVQVFPGMLDSIGSANTKAQ